jgi:hypothetical protein
MASKNSSSFPPSVPSDREIDEQDVKTTTGSPSLYKSAQDRDARFNSGLDPGIRETLDRLEELLGTMA